MRTILLCLSLFFAVLVAADITIRAWNLPALSFATFVASFLVDDAVDYYRHRRHRN